MDAIRVVLVEDHDLARLGLAAALQKQDGFVLVGEASNASQGLELLLREDPDIAIVDIGLPRTDGIELTQQLLHYQAQGQAPHTQVLILTMHEDEETVLAAFAAGAISYCTKHIQLARLLTAIRETHEGNAWIDPPIARVVLHQVQERSKPRPGQDPSYAANSNDPNNNDIASMPATPLTEREMEILELIVAGYSNADIGGKLYITIGTVKTHVRSILSKLSADDRTQAAVRALRSGLVS